MAASSSMLSLRISYLLRSHASTKSKKFLMHFNTATTTTSSSSLPCCKRAQTHRLLLTVSAAAGSDDSKTTEDTPSWAKPDSDEPPPWAQGEGNKDEGPALQVPFYAYLLASTITAIAAIGSIFEYINQKPIFGLLDSDSIFYAPILGFFALTGVPTSAFLWFKSVQAANKEAEEQDKRDGYSR